MMIILYFPTSQCFQNLFFKNKHFFFFYYTFFFFYYSMRKRTGQGWEGNTQVCELRTYLTLRQSFLSLALFKNQKALVQLSIFPSLTLFPSTPIHQVLLLLPTAPLSDQNNVLINSSRALRIQWKQCEYSHPFYKIVLPQDS